MPKAYHKKDTYVFNLKNYSNIFFNAVIKDKLADIARKVLQSAVIILAKIDKIVMITYYTIDS